MKFDENDLYEETDDIFERPKPRRGNPWRLLACALLIGAAWAAWMMHQRAVVRTAPPSELDVMLGAPPTSGPAAPVPDSEARPAPVPPDPLATQRRFYGVVYDIATKKPVSGAQILLVIGALNTRVNTMPCSTDLNGHYVCDLSKHLEEVSVQVSTEGYKGQFEDFFPTLRKRSEAERRAVLSQRDGYLEPAKVLFMASQEVVQLDLVVVPLGWLPQPRAAR